MREREPAWRELDALLARARGRPERLGPEGVRELGALYRAAAADLAFARRRFADDPVAARLEQLVVRARQTVYEAEPRRGSLRHFVSRGYWRLVRERPGALLLAACLLFGPALATAGWALDDPAAAIGLVPEQFRPAASPESGSSGLSPDQQAAFSSEVLANNVRVAFLAFAGGLLAGLGTAFVLVTNGLLFGAVGGLAVEAARGPEFIDLVAAHGVLELSCIVVAAAAGLRFGWTLIEPGRRRRRDALVLEGRRAVQIVLGTALWLGVAALVEGMVRAGQVAGPGPGLAVGLALAALYWALVVWRGRPVPIAEGRAVDAPEDPSRSPAGGPSAAAVDRPSRDAAVTAAPAPSP